MAIESGELGFDSIVIPGAAQAEYHGVRIIPAIILTGPDIRKVIGQIRNVRDSQTFTLVDAGDNGFNRAVLTQQGVHAIRKVHRAPRNAFDHVSARIAAEHGIAVDVDLSPLIQERGTARQKALNRYNDLMRLHARYDFPLTISSNAYSVLDLRSPGEMCLLCTLFGMQEEDAGKALHTVSALLAPAEEITVAP